MMKYTKINTFPTVSINEENIEKIKEGDYIKSSDDDFYEILKIDKCATIGNTFIPKFLRRKVKLKNIVTQFTFKYQIDSDNNFFKLVLLVKNNKSIYDEVI